MLTVRSHTRSLKIGVGFLALSALLIPHPMWMILLVCFGGAWGIAWGWMRVLRGRISAERHLQSNWVAIGDVLVEQFAIHNRSWLPVPYIEINDQSNVPGYRAAFVVAAKRNGTTDWRQAAVCTTRGRYQLGAWSLTFGDPFGFYELTIAYDQIEEIIIHPPILARMPVALPIGNSDGGRARRKQGWHAQMNAAGVRHYRPNDPLHHIHWRTTARHNTPFVREFEQDAAGDVWLLLDMAAANQFGTGDAASAEQCILLGAAIMDRVLRLRQAVGLAMYGKEPQIVPASRGAQQRWRLLEALATASADSDTSLATALRDVRRLIGSGAALQVVTAIDDVTDMLHALIELQLAGIVVHVALLERNGAGSEAMRDQILQRGIACRLVRREALRVVRPKQLPTQS